ncbi:MAG TPA: sigma-70 family RNA polymerase sigma factor [Spirochaetota bacterium]|nr:sigma-70 family RNA polymerase sigma factor [Spirochaetota bacterium]HQO40581.1 sigma-70 family RNA polymerase sigma factor [Spirochaetota bacterium]
MIQYSDAIISYLFTLPGTKAVRIFFSAIIKNLRSFIVFFSLIVRKDEGAGDNELIRAFIAGDMKSFELLAERYKDMAYNLCYNITGNHDEAMDCAQDSFIKAYRNLHRFEFRSSFSTWFYAICVNTCRNRLAASWNKKRVHVSGPVMENFRDCSPAPEDDLIRRENELAVRRAIAKLPDDERILVVLRDMEGQSYSEITEITGIVQGTVKSRLARARHRLRGLLEGELS